VGAHADGRRKRKSPWRLRFSLTAHTSRTSGQWTRGTLRSMLPHCVAILGDPRGGTGFSIQSPPNVLSRNALTWVTVR